MKYAVISQPGDNFTEVELPISSTSVEEINAVISQLWLANNKHTCDERCVGSVSIGGFADHSPFHFNGRFRETPLMFAAEPGKIYGRNFGCGMGSREVRRRCELNPAGGTRWVKVFSSS